MILKYPHEILASKAQEILNKDMLDMLLPAFKQSVEKHKQNALGLAAPQIGLSYKMIWIRDFGYLINPKIIETSPEKIGSMESCLSIPEKFYTVERYKWIRVLYWDEKFKKQRQLFTTLSIVAQHELNHLDGLCLSDYAKEINVVPEAEIKND